MNKLVLRFMKDETGATAIEFPAAHGGDQGVIKP